jgi:phosphoglycerate-specific signal transduction histidine kinase
MTTDQELEQIGQALSGVMQAVASIEAASKQIRLRVYQPPAETLQQHLQDAILRIVALEGTVATLRDRLHALEVDVDAIGQVPAPRISLDGCE